MGCYQFPLGPINSRVFMVQILPLDSPYISAHLWEQVQMIGLPPLRLTPAEFLSEPPDLSTYDSFVTLASVVFTCLGLYASTHFHPPRKHSTLISTAALKSSCLQYLFL